jgi:hypothetical protein
MAPHVLSWSKVWAENIDIVNGREIPGSLKGIKRSLDSIKVSKAIQKVYKSVERPATVSR